jgi:putative nucleotidyltransferase with HDIG domain
VQKITPPFQKDTPHSRHRYEESQSNEFLEWVNRLGWEKTLWGRIVLRLEESLSIRRLAYTFAFSLILSLALSFEIDIPLDYKVGDVAPLTLTSPISFQMVDEVSTEEARQLAADKVQPVVDFDLTIFEKMSSQIMRSFREMRSDLRLNKGNKKLKIAQSKEKFQDDLKMQISDGLFSWLVAKEFHISLEAQLLKILDVWYQQKVIDSSGFDKIASHKTILLRYIRGSEHEFVLDKNELVDLKGENLNLLRHLKGVEWGSLEDKDNLFLLSQAIVKPNAYFNSEETELRREATRSAVVPVIIKIRKNQAIVPEGTMIRPFHLALFKQIELLKEQSHPSILILVIAVIFSVVILVAHSFLKKYSPEKYNLIPKDYFVLATILVFEVLMTKLFLFVTETAFLSKFGNFLPEDFFLFLSPLAAGSLLVALIIPIGEVVFIFTLILSIVVAMMSGLNFALAFVVWVGGLAAARGVQSCKARNDIYTAGMRAGLVMALAMFCLYTVKHPSAGQWVKESFWMMAAGFFSGIFSSMWATIFIPLLESIFNYTTDVKLLELSNLNHPLLKEMLIKAPGSYHHSMMVGSMVEAAAEDIGANPLLGKVVCYYHDIGKMVHPNYFIENQKVGQNPHDHISPYMSKTLLISHVKDGVELGLKHKLGKPIIDGIVQHHGTTVITYFYNKARENLKEGDQDISEDEFRYPGPKPQFRESALCMLADSIEAASRTLDDPTPARLQNIVRNVIQKKFLDGQLDECHLTLKDLTKVEQSFVKILLGIYHQRIDYPKSFISQAAQPIGKSHRAQE